MNIFFKFFLTLMIAQIGFASFTQAAASVFVVTNIDNNNTGFNDPTLFTPVGGNNATTLGQARLIAFQYAADKIANVLSGNHVITIEASMPSLGGTAQQATLGGAGSVAYVYGFNNAPESDILYPIALANKFFGQDIDPSNADIRARFNCDIDHDDILIGSQWYYGLDAKADSQDIDFVTVVMHELIHGLGFSSTINLATGAKTDGKDDVYSRYLYHSGTIPSSYPDMTDQQRFFANSSKDLYWDGAHVNNQAQQYLSAGFSNNRVEMFAPEKSVVRSSLSHFSSSVAPNEMMEPFYTAADHDLGLARSVLSDIGWGNDADLSIMVTEQAVNLQNFTNEYVINVNNKGPEIARDVYVTSSLLNGEIIHQDDFSAIKCEQNNQGLLCNLGDIDSGTNISYRLTMVRNTLNIQQFKNSVVANIIDMTPENNQDNILVTGTAARLIISDVESGGGGMVEIFLIVILSLVLMLKYRKLL